MTKSKRLNAWLMHLRPSSKHFVYGKFEEHQKWIKRAAESSSSFFIALQTSAVHHNAMMASSKFESVTNLYCKQKVINFPGEATLTWLMQWARIIGLWCALVYTESDSAALPAMLWEKIKSPSHRCFLWYVAVFSMGTSEALEIRRNPSRFSRNPVTSPEEAVALNQFLFWITQGSCWTSKIGKKQ